MVSRDHAQPIDAVTSGQTPSLREAASSGKPEGPDPDIMDVVRRIRDGRVLFMSDLETILRLEATERRLRLQMLEISEHAGTHLCRAETAEARVVKEMEYANASRNMAARFHAALVKIAIVGEGVQGIAGARAVAQAALDAGAA